MRIALESLFKNVAFFLIDKHYRKFILLAIQLSFSSKSRANKLKLYGHYIIVPDAQSFVWQYYEIFFKDYYAFDSKNKVPVIFDCGANIGLSTIYFNRNTQHL